MKVFMLGWEFAPIKSGGLGVACKGITDGLQHHNVEVTFVMPSSFHQDFDQQISLAGTSGISTLRKVKVVSKKLKTVKVVSDFSFMNSPYTQLDREQFHLKGWKEVEEPTEKLKRSSKNLYGSNFFEEIEKFNFEAEELAKEHEHDVIHAHDWMTFEAGRRVKRYSKKPLIAHIHATEIDRTAGSPHPYIFQKEQDGLREADHIIVVSFYTKKILEHYYKIPGHKISVVHNAAKVCHTEIPKSLRKVDFHVKPKDKIVLFLGRVTVQKGPEYFVEVARKVLEKRKDVKFVIAGHGDMLPLLLQKIIEYGIQEHVFMSGYLTGQALNRALYHADLYMMPSVSEPFGISALEAVEFGIPVLMSKTSGAQEVIKNSLQADFWDIDKMANQVMAILTYPVLGKTLVHAAQSETQYLSWKAQAEEIKNIYQHLVYQ